MKKVLFQKGTVIFHQQEPATKMYSIISGQVGIYAAYGTEHQKLLVTLSSGKYFGEMAIVENLPRSATAVCEEDCELVVIEKENLEEFLSQNPKIAMDMICNLSQRVRSLTADFMEACKTIAQSMEEKDEKKGIRKKLSHYAQMYNQAMQEAYSVTVETEDGKTVTYNNFFDNYRIF